MIFTTRIRAERRTAALADISIRSRGDHFDMLTASEEQVELAVRGASASAAEIRSTALYTWADEDLAHRLWNLSHKKYLYYLEVDVHAVRHISDVNCYSLVGDEIASGRSPADAIKKYWSGAHESPHFVKDSCWPYFEAKA